MYENKQKDKYAFRFFLHGLLEGLRSPPRAVDEVVRFTLRICPVQHSASKKSPLRRGFFAQKPSSNPSLSSRSPNAELSLELLPVLSGAVEVVDAEIVSTLQGQNERDNAAVLAEGLEAGKKRGARFRLLFDPQVGGRDVPCRQGWGEVDGVRVLICVLGGV